MDSFNLAPTFHRNMNHEIDLRWLLLHVAISLIIGAHMNNQIIAIAWKILLLKY